MDEPLLALGVLAGEQVIVSGGDGTVRVWAADGNPRGEPLRGHAGVVNAIALGVLADEEVIVSGGDDGAARIWTPTDKRAIPVGESIR